MKIQISDITSLVDEKIKVVDLTPNSKLKDNKFHL
jgi:hypothetical protein